jgi:hypothetical protein
MAQAYPRPESGMSDTLPAAGSVQVPPAADTFEDFLSLEF